MMSTFVCGCCWKTKGILMLCLLGDPGHKLIEYLGLHDDCHSKNQSWTAARQQTKARQIDQNTKRFANERPPNDN
jgi:hypothetical protein